MSPDSKSMLQVRLTFTLTPFCDRNQYNYIKKVATFSAIEFAGRQKASYHFSFQRAVFSLSCPLSCRKGNMILLASWHEELTVGLKGNTPFCCKNKETNKTIKMKQKTCVKTKHWLSAEADSMRLWRVSSVCPWVTPVTSTVILWRTEGSSPAEELAQRYSSDRIFRTLTLRNLA